MFLKNFIVKRERFGEDRNKRNVIMYKSADIESIIVGNHAFVADANGWFDIPTEFRNELGTNWFSFDQLQIAIEKGAIIEDMRTPFTTGNKAVVIEVQNDLTAVVPEIEAEAADENNADEDTPKRRGRPKKEAE